MKETKEKNYSRGKRCGEVLRSAQGAEAPHYLLVGVQMRLVGQHVGRRGHPPRFQLHQLRQLPVVQEAAAQPVKSKGGFPSCRRSLSANPVTASCRSLQPRNDTTERGRATLQADADTLGRSPSGAPAVHAEAAAARCERRNTALCSCGPKPAGPPSAPGLASALKGPGTEGVCPNIHAPKGDLLELLQKAEVISGG